MNGQDRCTCVNGDDNIPVVKLIDGTKFFVASWR